MVAVRGPYHERAALGHQSVVRLGGLKRAGIGFQREGNGLPGGDIGGSGGNITIRLLDFGKSKVEMVDLSSRDQRTEFEAMDGKCERRGGEDDEDEEDEGGEEEEGGGGMDGHGLGKKKKNLLLFSTEHGCEKIK